MKKSKRCPKCNGREIERGHQEIFPSTFMRESKYSLVKALVASKEFEIYACMDCGYAEWYIQDKYLEKNSERK